MFSTLVHGLTFSQINKIKPYIYDLYTGCTHWFTFECGDGYSRLVIWFDSEDSKPHIVFTEAEDMDISGVIDEFINSGCMYGTGKSLMLIPELKEEMQSNVWYMFEENMLVEAGKYVDPPWGM